MNSYLTVTTSLQSWFCHRAASWRSSWPLTAAAPRPSPGLPNHTGLGNPEWPPPCLVVWGFYFWGSRWLPRLLRGY